LCVVDYIVTESLVQSYTLWKSHRGSGNDYITLTNSVL